MTSETTGSPAPATSTNEGDTAGSASSGPRRSRSWLLAVALIVAVAVIALQVVTLRTAGDARNAADEAATLAADALAQGERQAEELDALEATLADLEQELDLANLAGSLDTDQSSDATADAALPPYPATGPDTAVASGLGIASFEGEEYYSGERLTITPDGDTATVWLVWAHWCPHCQNDLPVLDELWETEARDLPHVQLVTITTAIDDTRGNPLLPYLDSSQFSFPVLVDTDGSLASHLGTTAFPFWVVTGPDGRVLLRRPGALGADQIRALLFDLEDFAAG